MLSIHEMTWEPDPDTGGCFVCVFPSDRRRREQYVCLDRQDVEKLRAYLDRLLSEANAAQGEP